MRDDLRRGNFVQRLEIEREQPPCRECRGGRSKALARFGHALPGASARLACEEYGGECFQALPIGLPPPSLLMNGDSPGAEKVFREDLERNLRNPRSLWGLREALLQQKRGYDAGFVQKQFQASWKGGAQALKLDDLV